MNNIQLKFLSITLLVVTSLSFSQVKKKTQKEEKEIINVVNYVLQRSHYNPKKVTKNDISKEIYDNFLKSLDSDKLYFLKSDIEEFKPYKDIISLQIKYNDIGFFNVVEERLAKRQKEVSEHYEEIFKDLKLEKKEDWIDPDSLNYCNDLKEIKDRWRMFIKSRVVSKIYNKIKKEDKNVKKDSTHKRKTIAVIKKEVIKSEKKQFKELFEYVLELDRDDRFSIFVNSITKVYDPHTNYFPPQQEKQFNISMSGELEGIGAVLTRKDGYIVVNEIVIGGPAWKQGELKKDDKILSSGTLGKEPTNLVGMKLADGIEFIRGKKGTVVVLSVKDKEGNIKDIHIVRDIVKIDETYAKSAIINKGEKKYGFIHLPSFYIDFKKVDEVNCAIDMKREILALKKEGVEGLIIDLRRNGGGSLPSVVEIGGYFIDKGPIVQVKSLQDLKILKDRDSGTLWDGKLIIMVDNSSASASEILSAAMQDYNRAIIVGVDHTYGKGTVQNFLNLDNLVKNKDGKLGALKVTIQKFYRVNGGSTQLKGVIPDIIFPNLSNQKYGEKQLHNAMPWDKINPAKINPIDPVYNLSKIKENYNNRIDTSYYFNLIERKRDWLDKEKNSKSNLSIGLNEFIEESKISQEKSKEFDDLKKYKNNLSIEYPIHDKDNIKKDSTLREKRERWHKNLNKDIQLEEIIRILEEM